MDTPKTEKSVARQSGGALIEAPHAYIKAVLLEGRSGYGIYSSDGEMIGWNDSREVAIAAVRQHGLHPFSVH